MTTGPIIRAEIRKWLRVGNTITGVVFNDIDAIYDNGEPIVLMSVEMQESTTFFLVKSQTGRVYKLEKDERA